MVNERLISTPAEYGLHSLNLETFSIAFGTKRQSESFMGCEEGQGYFFGRPMPAGEFEAKFLTAPAAPAEVA